MKQVTLYNLMEVEDVSDILLHFDVENLEDIPKNKLLKHLLSEFGEQAIEECDNDQFDLIDDDSFLDDRVDEDDDMEGHILVYQDESILWQYFKISDEEKEDW